VWCSETGCVAELLIELIERVCAISGFPVRLRSDPASLDEISLSYPLVVFVKRLSGRRDAQHQDGATLRREQTDR
jgi:hypothetical protein